MAINNIQVHVQKIEPIGKGRFKVKIAETGAKINTLSHNGRELVATKDLGRGRYIMRAI